MDEALTFSETLLYLQGPKYSPETGDVNDAVGARFAIDYETTSASNGFEVSPGGT